ncbi:MAG: GNAT family N-acetyltransferase [Acidaminococcaceae bacterium]
MLRKLDFNDGLVRAEWQDLYCRNHHLLPYASREYNELFNNYFRMNRTRLFLQKRFYGFYDETDNLLMIVPLCIKGRELHIFGDFGNGEILDFVYPYSLEQKYFQQLLTALHQEFPGYRLVLNRLAPDSPLRIWLRNNRCRSLRKRSLARIQLPASYEDYLQNLPLDVLADIKRAEKFVAQLGVPYNLEFTRGAINNEHRKQYFRLYDQKYNDPVSKLKTLSKRYTQRKFSALTDACTKESNSFNACLYIGKELVAFAAGFFDLNEKKLLMRKSATSNQYAKNLVELFLYTQTIKWLIEHTDFEWLDLGELRNKYRTCLGCEEYYCYSYEIKL